MPSTAGKEARIQIETLPAVGCAGLIGLFDYGEEDRPCFQGQIIDATITPPSGKATKLKM